MATLREIIGPYIVDSNDENILYAYDAHEKHIIKYTVHTVPEDEIPADILAQLKGECK